MMVQVLGDDLYGADQSYVDQMVDVFVQDTASNAAALINKRLTPTQKAAKETMDNLAAAERMPYLIIAGAVLIGGIVLFSTMKK